jgi:TonB family protein
VQALAEAVRAATVERRGEVVAQGLPKACELPAGVEAYLAATEPGASEDSRVRALREGSSMLTEICDDVDTLQQKASKLEASRRAEMLYDACGLGRLNLVDRSAWLRSRPTSVMPFVALEWLKRQGASADEAKAIASALLLRGKRTWGLAGQRVVTIDGHLEPIPEGAIEVAITSRAIFVEGVSVVELDDGALPKAKAPDDDPMKILERALLAEREAQDGVDAPSVAIVADEGVLAANVIPVLEIATADAAQLGVVGFVARSRPAEYGLVRFDIEEGYAYGTAKLDIDAKGFELTPPRGGTSQHLGVEGADDPYDFGALEDRAEEYAKANPDRRSVVVGIADDTTIGVLLATVHHLRGKTCVSDSDACFIRTIEVRRGGDRAAEVARKAGVLGALSSSSGSFLASPYGGAFAVGDDDEDVWGGLTGTEVGEAYGVGGLGLVGTGRGGGGTGEGTIGSIGGGSGSGGSAGLGGISRRVPRVRQSKATVKGSLDKDIIRRIVRAHINEVRHCYNKGLAKDDTLSGKVVVDFTIAATGKVSEAEVDSTTVSDEDVGKCIAKAAKRWKFPKPRGGGVVVVKYPFVLAPG